MNPRCIGLLEQILNNVSFTPQNISLTPEPSYHNTHARARADQSVSRQKEGFLIPVIISAPKPSNSTDNILPCSPAYSQFVVVQICCTLLYPTWLNTVAVACSVFFYLSWDVALPPFSERFILCVGVSYTHFHCPSSPSSRPRPPVNDFCLLIHLVYRSWSSHLSPAVSAIFEGSVSLLWADQVIIVLHTYHRIKITELQIKLLV